MFASAPLCYLIFPPCSLDTIWIVLEDPEHRPTAYTGKWYIELMRLLINGYSMCTDTKGVGSYPMKRQPFLLEDDKPCPTCNKDKMQRTI